MTKRPLFDEDWLPENEDNDEGSYSTDYDYYFQYDENYEEDSTGYAD